MRDILVRKEFEDKYDEKIITVMDIEGFEGKEIKPLGKFGWKINTSHTYKILTDRSIYFLEDGKVVNIPSWL